MRELNIRLADVKPSELKKGDRIHTACGPFDLKSITKLPEIGKGYYGLELRPSFGTSKKKAGLIVHKTMLFNVNRPLNKK